MSVMGENEDWLSRTMRTVEAVMEQHGFVEDAPPEAKPSVQEVMTTWDKLLRTFTLLACPKKKDGALIRFSIFPDTIRGSVELHCCKCSFGQHRQM
jgi:hypothetical protein